MRHVRGRTGFFLLLISSFLPLAMTGCEHHYYRVYDSSYGDYHRWDDDERGYYRRWAVENHVDPDRDFRHLKKDEQKRYWDWRHGHDHDRDHDRDHH